MPHDIHAATQHLMRGRFTSLLVLIGLLFGIVVMPTMAHAVSSSPIHGNEMLAVQEIEEADHSHSQGADKDMPCHALVHHHCGVALATDSDPASLEVSNGKAAIMPLVVQPMASLALVPPTEPPAA